ncbi:DEAD/DEAH box helicase family protein [Kribbella sp. NPDC059898]|uniref:DEAD/DEAH box helicase family protein n=1 Tax=Kribbella sp. NPDC059898 TaxID=3346995 RepID=UPI0036521786
MRYYESSNQFRFLAGASGPGWRIAQEGAVAALVKHWSTSSHPGLISLPTGAGKSAVALAAPHLCKPQRVLVVVPTRQLRSQLVAAFESQQVLRTIGAVSGRRNPAVVELTGMVDDWSVLRTADVVVALPNTISPVYYDEHERPPHDLFDLVVIDEAHHAPARTWRAILEHFADARAVLLTATPRRRDGQQLPGEELYYYPVKLALDHGFYKPVQPRIIGLPTGASQEFVDRAIAAETVAIANLPEHASSSILIRAKTRVRAEVLAGLYRELGLEVSTLYSGIPRPSYEELMERVRSGECRAVAVVNMLGEGFDLPRLRIAAYHDKHRSLMATVQFLGRFARMHTDYPQPSTVVAARDVDVYPQLRDAVRELYKQDADWARVLPGLIDDEIVEQRADRVFAADFAPAPPTLSLEALRPGCSVLIFEVPTDAGYEPDFLSGAVPEALHEGQRLAGQTIFYSAVSPTGATLLLVTTAIDRPRWHPNHPGLDAPTYDLHLLTWRRAQRVDEPHLLLVNSHDRRVMNVVLQAVGADGQLTTADPRQLQDAFDALDRASVSSVGVRNTYRGSVGVPSYTMFAGSQVDRGLRDADTGRRALGHAIAQIGSGPGSYSAGVATAKGKYWESRALSLRNYEAFTAELASRYWLPTVSAAGRLLPNVTRGERLRRFPDSAVALVENSPGIRGLGWVTVDGEPVEELELHLDTDRTRSDDSLPLAAFSPTAPGAPLWRGSQGIDGHFSTTGPDLQVQLGYGSPLPLEDLLTARPPSIFFLDGQTVIGAVGYQSIGRTTYLPAVDERTIDWGKVDITSETKKKAAEKQFGISIHEELERYLKAQPRRMSRRWILCNDGQREIADYIVIEMDPGRRVAVSLWHAKAANSAQPGVRVNDVQTVAQQAIKSRTYITDPGFWRVLGARLTGKDTPAIEIVEGSERLLLLLCGHNANHSDWGIARRPPIVTGRIAIAQPGLSMTQLRSDLATTQPTIAAQQIREFLTVLHDSVSPVADIVLLTSD